MQNQEFRMWLIIIFILGTLCVIFNEKIGEFLSGIIDFDLFFLSKKEKKIKQQQQAFLKDSPEKLYPVYEFILQKYAHASVDHCRHAAEKNNRLFRQRVCNRDRRYQSR